MIAARAMLSPAVQPLRAGARFVGRSVARRRIVRTVLGYAGLLTLATVVLHVSRRPDVAALALGIAFPGAGFLTWTMLGSTSGLAFTLFAGSIALFLAALVLWFATGNVVLPAVVWIGAAVAASVLIARPPAIFVTSPLPPLLAWIPAVLLVGLVSAAGLATLMARRSAARRIRLDAEAPPWGAAGGAATVAP